MGSCTRMVFDGPQEHPVEPVSVWLGQRGWKFEKKEFTTTEFGELLYRRRWVVFATREAEPLANDLWNQIRMPVAPPCSVILGGRNRTPREWRKVDRLVLDPRTSTARGPLEPRGVGHFWRQEERRFCLGT